MSSPEITELWRTLDGTQIYIRASRASDAESVAEAMRTASPRTIRNRFFSQLRDFPIAQLRSQLEVDPENEVCLVATLRHGDAERVIGGVRFIRIDPPNTAEVAITIHDDFQRQGLGTHLMKLIHRLAPGRGIERFTAEVLAENRAILKLIAKFGPIVVTRHGAGIQCVHWQV